MLDLLDTNQLGTPPNILSTPKTFTEHLKITRNTKNQKGTPTTYENIHKHPRTPKPSLKLPKTHLNAQRISKIYNTWVLREIRVELLFRLGMANLLKRLKNFLT